MRLRGMLIGAVALTGVACDSDEPSTDPARADAAPSDAAAPATWPDLRFKGVDAFPEYTSSVSQNVTFALGGGGMKIAFVPPNRHAFTPLQLDASSVSAGGNYSWDIVDFAPAAASEALSAVAQTGAALDFEAARDELFSAGQMVTSLDLKPEAYALVAVATASGASTYEPAGFAQVARADLDEWAAREGAAGRVVTALAARADRIHVLSYGKRGDSHIFETRVLDASLATLFERADELGQAGYTITGFGQTGADAFVLVGTRIEGQTAPRAVFTETATQGPAFTAAVVDHGLAEGYAIVGLVFAASGSKVIGQR